MYDWLPEVCREIRQNLVEVYWLSLGPLVTFLIILQFFNIHEKAPNAVRVLQRALLSVLMLVSFEEVMHLIANVGDSLTLAISPKPKISQILDEVWKFVQGTHVSWYKLKETVIWLFGLLSFTFAYLGAFIADALVHFCWAILYVLSPLMILCYIPERTSGICKSLYHSMCMVMTWKVMWALLSTILLQFVVNAPIENDGNYNAILLIVINLFIGVSLLLVPITTNAFIKSDFSGYAAGLAVAPALAGKTLLLRFLKNLGNQVTTKRLKKVGAGARESFKASRFVARRARRSFQDFSKVKSSKAKDAKPTYFKSRTYVESPHVKKGYE